MGNCCSRLCCKKKKFDESLIYGKFAGSFGSISIGKHEILAFGTDFKANWINDYVIRMEWDDSTSSHDELLVYIVKTDTYAHIMEKSSAPISDAIKFNGPYMYWRTSQICCCFETTLCGRDLQRQQKIKHSLPKHIHGHFKKINIPLGKSNEIQHETYGNVLINWLNPGTFLFIHPAYDNKEIYVYDNEADGWWVFRDMKGTVWDTRHKNKKTQFLKRLGLDEILAQENTLPTMYPSTSISSMSPGVQAMQRGSIQYTEEQKAKIRDDTMNTTSDADDGSKSSQEQNEEKNEEDIDHSNKTRRRSSVYKNRRKSSVAASSPTIDQERRRSSGTSKGRHRQTSVSGLRRKSSTPNISPVTVKKKNSIANQPGALDTLISNGERRSSTVYVESMGMVMNGEDTIRNSDRIKRNSVSQRRRSSIERRQFINQDNPADIDFK